MLRFYEVPNYSPKTLDVIVNDKFVGCIVFDIAHGTNFQKKRKVRISSDNMKIITNRIKQG